MSSLTEHPEIDAFIRAQSLAVESTNAPGGAPQSAVVGVVAGDGGEVFFDTLATTRKHANLLRDGRISMVLGWDLATACTVQLEGVADAPEGDELERWLALYLARFPDGVARRALPDIRYWRVRPTWIRWSDYRGAAPVIIELRPSTGS